MTGTKPYGRLQFKEINGKQLADVDEGRGDAIVFQHGNPSSTIPGPGGRAHHDREYRVPMVVRTAMSTRYSGSPRPLDRVVRARPTGSGWRP